MCRAGRRCAALRWLLLVGRGLLAGCALLASCGLPAGEVLAQEPWDEPIPYSKLTAQQRQRAAQRTREQAAIREMYDYAIDDAVAEAADMYQRDVAIFGDKNYESARSLHFVCDAFYRQEAFETALKLKILEAKIYEETDGGKTWRYYSVMNRARIWQQTLQQGRRRYRDVYSDNWDLYNRADNQRSNNPAAALEQAKRCAATFRDLLGELGIAPETNPDFADALMLCAKCQRQLGQYKEAEGTVRAALSIYAVEIYDKDNQDQKLFGYGPKHPVYADALDELARVHRNKGELTQAEQAYRESLDILEAAHRGPHRDKAVVLEELGDIYLDRHQYELAEATLQRALDVQSKSDGAYKWNYANALTDLAAIYNRTQRLELAQQKLDELMVYTAKEFGKDSTEYGNAVYELGLNLANQEKYEESLAKQIEASKVYYNTYGKDHAYYAMVSAQIGWMNFKLERYDKAEPYLKGCAASLRRKLGDRHGFTLTLVSNYEQFLLDRAGRAMREGDFATARADLEAILKIRGEMHGADDWRVVQHEAGVKYVDLVAGLEEEPRAELLAAGTRHQEAWKLHGAGDYPAALAAAEEAAAVRRKHLAELPNYLADSSYLLGHCYDKLGRSGEAEQYYREATNLYTKAAGERRLPAEVAYSVMRLGDRALERNELAQAEQYFHYSGELYRQIRGDKHVDYANLLTRRARVKLQLEQSLDAEILLRESLQIHRAVGGEQTADYLDALGRLAAIVLPQSDLAEAQTLYQDVEHLLSLNTGLGDDRRFQLRLELAALRRREGKLAQARDLLEALRSEYAAKADLKQQMAELAFALGDVQLELGDAENAQRNLRAAVDGLASEKLPVERAVARLAAALEGKARGELSAGRVSEAQTGYDEIAALYAAHLGAGHWRAVGAKWRRDAVSAVAGLGEAQRKDVIASFAAAAQAGAALEAGDFAKALSGAETVVKQRAALSRESWLALDALALHATALERNGNYKASSAAWQTVADAVGKALGEHPVAADALLEAGKVALWQGEFEAARRRFAIASDICLAATGPRSVEYGVAQSQLARCYLRLGKFPEAEAALDRAEAYLRQHQLEYPAQYCQVLQTTAELALMLGDTARGAKLARQAYEFSADAVGASTETHAHSMRLHGEALLMSGGDAAEADSLLALAVQLYVKRCGANSLPHVQGLLSLSRARLQQGKLPEANQSLAQAGTIARSCLGDVEAPLLADLLRWQGVLHMAAGKSAEARASYTKALDVRRRLDGQAQLEYLTALREFGDLSQMAGDNEQASTAFREYMRLVRERLDQAALGQSEQEQLVLAEQYRGALDRYLSLPHKDDNLETLYQQVLAWKGATLVRQYQIRALRSREELKSQFQAWELTAGRLATAATRLPFKEEAGFWHRQVEFLAGEKDRLEIELMRQAPADALTPMPTVEQLRAALPTRTVLVDFLEYEHREASSEGLAKQRRLIAFLLGPNLPLTRVDLGSADEAKLHIERWRDSSKRVTDLVFAVVQGDNEQRAQLEPAAEELFAAGAHLRRTLWLPLTIHLDKVDTVLLSPDGALTIFPFGALPGAKDGAYLLEEHSFAVVPAPRLLPAMLAKSASGAGAEPSLLAFGGIDYFAAPQRREETLPNLTVGAAAGADMALGAGLFPRESPVQPLANTGPEVEKLAVMFREKFPGAALEKFASELASENQFRRLAPKHRWLHLATHGFYSDSLLAEAQLGRRTTTAVGPSLVGLRQAPAMPPVDILRPELTSGLTMAGANEANASNEDDGVLWAMEIAAADLSGVDMVVLSACDASQGMMIPGEGTLSLQRAFQVAGARSIVSTLWPVNDLATRLLMQRFYKNLLENPSMSKLEAMREAQLWMIASSRRTINEEPAELGEMTETSRYLFPFYELPSFWAAFVVTGQWQ